MEDFAGLLSGILMLAALFYIIYLQPKQEKRREQLIFDNRVLATIDGLYLSGMKFGCADFEMRAHARRMLEKAHALPDGEYLLSHTITMHSAGRGRFFRSRIGLHGEHRHFALLCIIDRADPHYNAELIAQCEEALLLSPDSVISY